MPGFTVRFLPLVIAACMLTTLSIALTAQAEEPGVSRSIVLTNEPVTLQVDAEWGKVPRITPYKVQWRPQDGELTDDSSMSTTNALASLEVANQGLWVVRVEDCDDNGCNRINTWAISVGINIPGYEAIRLWYDAEGVYLDWAVVEQARQRGLLSAEQFSVDGTLLKACASLKSFSNRGKKRICALPVMG